MASLSFTLNGETVTAATEDSPKILLDWLRSRNGLKGTKEGCAEGDCGACSVLLSPVDGGSPRPVNACLLAVGQVAGRSVTTIEGLGNSRMPHPLQSTMSATGGTQCGFCTPGFVVAGAALLDRTASPQDEDIHDALAGNLCRCTGYRPIVDAVKAAAGHTLPLPEAAPTLAAGDLGEVLAPESIGQALEMSASTPNARYLAGGTDLMLERRQHSATPLPLISLACVKEIASLRREPGKLVVGAACPIEDMLEEVETLWPHFGRVLRRFGSVQIRSQATLGGNLATCSPIGDAAPCLIALDSSLRIVGPKGERRLAAEDFALGYRKSALQPNEIVAEIEIPIGPPLWAWKVSKRYDQDISTLSAAFRLDRNPSGTIASARAAFGGLADRPLRCPPVEDALVNGDFDAAAKAMAAYFKPIDDLRGSAAYRSLAVAGLVQRLRYDLAGERDLEVSQL